MFPSPAQQPTIQDQQQPKPTTKPPVIRGARACTVCRAAKMKCVGGEENVKPCQRCKRTGVECIFEKHRRGRKPGSKLSEASRVLRHLEKGLSDAKAKSQQAASSQLSRPDAQSAIERFPNNELPPLNIPPDYEPGPSHKSHNQPSHPMDVDDSQEDDPEKRGEGLYPAQLIRKAQNERTSFFKTILNPEPSSDAAPASSSSRPTAEMVHAPSVPPRSHTPCTPPVQVIAPIDPSELKDPISSGLIDERQAVVFFDLFFLRLNPFINLFDPALHTVQYVRSHCPFLFSTIIMACCKFFQPELYPRALQVANAYALRAFAENWKRIEVVQAFACLTYWKEPHDTRTWTYIGYASRMAVELGLNKFVGKRPQEETEFLHRERRNRERTFLVLFVHDRSLSTQTGRQWMLPEDELVRHSVTWHGDGPSAARAEDVIVASFVQLQRISSETTESFRGTARDVPVNHDVLLRTCNGKLTQWMDTWQHEMRRAGGEAFHFCVLNIFKLHVRLFLNSFGVQASMGPSSRSSPNMQALSACFSSALEILQYVTKDFAQMSMLRYAQDSVTVMTAYAAIFLLKLLRSSNTMAALHEGAADEIYQTILRVSDAYMELSTVSAAHHARFLRNLVELDIHRAKQAEQDRRMQQQQHESPASMYRRPILPPTPTESHIHLPPPRNITLPPLVAPQYSHSAPRDQEYSATVPSRTNSTTNYGYPSPSPSNSGPSGPSQPTPSGSSSVVGGSASPVAVSTESDVSYWKNMFRDLGFGEGLEPAYPNVVGGNGNGAGASSAYRQDGTSMGGSANGGYHHDGTAYAPHGYSQHPHAVGSYMPPPPGFGP